MKELRQCLTGTYKGFHGQKHFDELMRKHHGFHYKDGIWFVRDAWFPQQIVIFKMWFEAETSAQPQSEVNEQGVVDFVIDFDINSFSSAIACMTNNSKNYRQIIKMFLQDLSVSPESPIASTSAQEILKELFPNRNFSFTPAEVIQCMEAYRNQADQDGWFDVKDGLPPETDKYYYWLYHEFNNSFSQGEYNYEERTFVDIVGERLIRVTHWKIPQPPKQ